MDMSHTTPPMRAGSSSTQPGSRSAANTIAAMSKRTGDITEAMNSGRLPDRPLQRRLTKNLQVRTTPAARIRATVAYTDTTECPWNAHHWIASWLTASTFAHRKSHTPTKQTTSSHEIATLTAATFILT